MGELSGSGMGVNKENLINYRPDQPTGGPDNNKPFEATYLITEEKEIDGLRNQGFYKYAKALEVLDSAIRRNPNLVGLNRLENAVLTLQNFAIEENVPEGTYGIYEAAIGRRILELMGETKQPDEQKLLPPSVRPYEQISDEMHNLLEHPDQDREQEVREELETLGHYAKEIGVFEGLKTKIEQYQSRYSYLQAARKIKEIDVDALEAEARGLSGWDDRLENVLSLYQHAALFNMMKAWKDSKGEFPDGDVVSQEEWENVDRFVEMLNFEDPPQNKIRDLVLAELERQRNKATTQLVPEGEDEYERLPTPENEAGWIKMILKEIEKAERYAETKLKKSDQEKAYWKPIEKALERMSPDLGTIDTTSPLARFMRNEFPNGLTLKDRLTIYFNARRSVMDRYIEVSKANGDLTAMGIDKPTQLEEIVPELEPLQNEHLWAIIHTDEILPEANQAGILTPQEKKELLPDVDTAMSVWWNVGRANSTLPWNLLTQEERNVLRKIFSYQDRINRYYYDPNDPKSVDYGKKRPRKLGIETFWPSPKDLAKVLTSRDITDAEFRVFMGIPTFKNSLNDKGMQLELHRRIKNYLNRTPNSSGQGEVLANRLFTITLSFALFDRDRAGTQGTSADRDTMWGARARRYNFGVKEREPGGDYMIGRDFSDPDQHFAIKVSDAKSNEKLAYRREMLEVNAQRAVWSEDEGYMLGEYIGDFFGQFVFVQDELVRGGNVRRRLLTYAVNRDGTAREGGWKKMPLLQMGKAAYEGYFGYTWSKARQIAQEMSGPVWKKPEELQSPSFWSDRRQLFDRIEHLFPLMVDLEYRFRGQLLRQELLRRGGFDPKEVEKIWGYCNPDDLRCITDPNKRNAAISIARGKEPSNPRQDVKFRNSKGKMVDLAKAAEDLAELDTQSRTNKLRLVHALGQIADGSLLMMGQMGNWNAPSLISAEMYSEIVKAMMSANYLGPVDSEYMQQFLYECDKELKFGTKFFGKPKARYK